MELRWLEDFIALARVRHFSRAAEQRHVSQPTFSRRIKLLEESVGVPLINRDTLPLSLTPSGEIFLATAQEISERMHDTRLHCKQVVEQENQRVSFATSQSLYLSLYKSRIEPLAAQHEIDIRVNLRSVSWLAEDYLDAMREGQCDLMLAYAHPGLETTKLASRDEFECVQLGNDQLIPVSISDPAGQPKYPLPGSRPQPVPFISYRSNSQLGAVLQTALKSGPETHLTVLNENQHASSVAAMIKQGFGAGWVPSQLVAEELASQTLALAGDTHWHIPLRICLYRRRGAAKPAAERLWQSMNKPQTV